LQRFRGSLKPPQQQTNGAKAKTKMREYSTLQKARVVARLIGPNAVSASALARETGISLATLSRWRQAAAKIPAMPRKRPTEPGSDPRAVPAKAPARRRSGADKLAVVVRAEGLEGEALGAFLRSEGIHLAELEQWRKLASDALSGTGRHAPSKEIRRLRADLARKEKALAETAALIVLKKKVAEIWGAEDDDTEETSE
jgi:transposase